MALQRRGHNDRQLRERRAERHQRRGDDAWRHIQSLGELRGGGDEKRRCDDDHRQTDREAEHRPTHALTLRLAAVLGNHRDGALGQRDIAIDHEDTRAGASEQNCRRPAIADAVARRPATGDDRDLAGHAPVGIGLCRHRSHNPGRSMTARSRRARSAFV